MAASAVNLVVVGYKSLPSVLFKSKILSAVPSVAYGGHCFFGGRSTFSGVTSADDVNEEVLTVLVLAELTLCTQLREGADHIVFGLGVGQYGRNGGVPRVFGERQLRVLDCA